MAFWLLKLYKFPLTMLVLQVNAFPAFSEDFNLPVNFFQGNIQPPPPNPPS